MCYFSFVEYVCGCKRAALDTYCSKIRKRRDIEGEFWWIRCARTPENSEVATMKMECDKCKAKAEGQEIEREQGERDENGNEIFWMESSES
jgi:hypothetical protein